VHPSNGSFLGRNIEFEMMFGGQRVFSKRHSNDDIIYSSHYENLGVVSLEEDVIYRDYTCDNKLEEDFDMRFDID
jgi:hypothetical protein